MAGFHMLTVFWLFCINMIWALWLWRLDHYLIPSKINPVLQYLQVRVDAQPVVPNHSSGDHKCFQGIYKVFMP